MKKRFFTLFLSLFFSLGYIHCFEPPLNYKFETEDEIKNYEPQILESIEWITSTPLTENKEKRIQVNGFLVAWLTKSHTVTIEIRPEIITFMEKNPELLIPFMAGWTKYSIENNSKDNIKGNQAGIETVVDFYDKNIGNLKKDKAVEKYKKMISKGELEKYISKVYSK